MAQNPAASEYRGLDLGTSRIVLAELKGNKTTFREELNAFVALPYQKMTVGMLEKEGIHHLVDGEEILIYGNRVDEFANLVGGSVRRPMQTGILNPIEPDGISMLEAMLGDLLGKSKRGQKVCFSVPAEPVGGHGELVFHDREVARMLEELGYEVTSINEGLAVVYSEMQETEFTGIGMSFGGGMCNICVAYRGLPALTLAVPRAGDYIDENAAAVTGETETTVRMRKEKDLKLGAGSQSKLDRALAVYYREVMEGAVAALEAALNGSRSLPRFDKPLPAVCSGGTSRVPGFMTEFRKVLGEAQLPVEIAACRHAEDPLNTTAKGALISAMVNM